MKPYAASAVRSAAVAAAIETGRFDIAVPYIETITEDMDNRFASTFDNYDRQLYECDLSFKRAFREECDPEQAINLLKPYLNSNNKMARSIAVEFIGDIGKPKDVNLILPMLGDASLHVKLAAIKAVGQLGAPEHIKILKNYRDFKVYNPLKNFLARRIRTQANDAIENIKDRSR